MASIIETSRNSCALHGAIQALQAIKGAIPIVHSTAGCGLQHYLGGNRASGCSGSGNFGGLATVSTNVIEKQIVFGGTSRLREQIKNTVRLVQGDFYVVLSGCATELVGDDIPAMTKEAREQGYPVINITTPGFRGDIHSGYQLVVKGILEQLPKIVELFEEKVTGLVNILGIVPGQDVFWSGDLAEIKRILENVGLKANTLFGLDQGVEQWKQIPSAELNLVFSPWGIEIAKYLAEKYATPYLDFNHLPVGTEETDFFIQAVAEKLNLNREIVDEFKIREEKQLSYYLEKTVDIYFESGFQKDFALIGEFDLSVGILKFLTNTFGLIPKVLVITDNPNEKYRSWLTEAVNQLAPGLQPKVVFSEDAGQIYDIIKASDVELILGSSLEKKIAAQLQLPLLRTSFPINDRVILGKTYVGYQGAINLVEDLSNAILS